MIYKLKAFSTYLAATLTLIALFLSAQQLAAQTRQLWIYTVVQFDDSYNLMKVYVNDGQSELILSLPKTAQVALSSVIPSTEINAAQNFFQQYTEAFNNIDVNLFLAQQPIVTVRSIAPAPDNESVALNVTYQACARGYYDEVCFGTSQIILVSGTTGQQQVLWSLGFHSDQYLPGRLLPAQDVQINDLLWLPDQQALVVAISDDTISRNQGNLSIIVVPTLQDVPSFRVGEGVTWAVAPNSREMAVISRTSGLSHTLHIISFVPTTGQFSETSSSLGTYVVFPDFGQAYIQTSPVFLISYDAASIDSGSSLGVFSPTQPVSLALYQSEIGGYQKIQSATTGNVAVIRNSDGLLWKAVISDGVLQIEPLTEYPVTFWQFVEDDILVIQFEGSTLYQVLDLSNIPPTANAGPDQTLLADSGNTALVALDGSSSTDMDGVIEAYRWAENDTLIAEGMTPQVELGVGEHTITLTVVDDDGAIDRDDVVITVEPFTGCTLTSPADPPTYTVAAGDVPGLIAAISAANANPDPDIIALEESTYTLTAAHNTGYGKNGLPIITTPISIHGYCATIERDPAAEAFRFFQVNASGSLTLYDLTLTGGDGGTTNGGAIYSQGTVTATHTTIANSTAPGGGGIRNSGGTVTLVDSRLEGNSASGSGGGLYNGGTATLTGTTLTGNAAANYGGGLYLSSGGTLMLSGSLVETNTAYNGAGVFMNGGSLTATGSQITGNTASHKGGGVFNSGGSLALSGSTVAGNSATDDGGGIASDGPLSITGSLVLNNQSGEQGGGVYNDTSASTGISDSCISGNTGAEGGGVYSKTANFSATGNWWGAADGPSGAGPGSGDAVNARVLFAPFLTAGCPH